MNWNYRLLFVGDDYFKIVECYYNDKDEPIGYCDAEIALSKPTIENFDKSIEMMRDAIDSPILHESDIVVSGL